MVRVEEGAIVVRKYVFLSITLALVLSLTACGPAPPGVPPFTPATPETTPTEPSITAPTTSKQVNPEDVEWLAKVVASEAGSVYDAGNWVRCTDEERAAVGWTVLNRLQSGKFGRTIREVVSAPGQYAHNQNPTPEIIELVTRILEGRIADATRGATHFFSPISMPWEGDEGQFIERLGGHFDKFDTGGGLQEVPGIIKRVYFPSWTKELAWVESLNNVRGAYFMFYRPLAPFTEFYIGSREGTVAFPTSLTVGQETSITLGIVNREGHPLSYWVRIVLTGEEVARSGNIALEYLDTWEGEVHFVPREAGSNQKLEFELYREGDIKPYLSPLYLWVDVKP